MVNVTSQTIYLQVLEIMLSDVGRKIVDLDGTEQKAQREDLGAVHDGRVATERALSVQ